MKKMIVVPLLWLLSSEIFASEAISNENFVLRKKSAICSVSISYFGEFVSHPGIEAGVESPLFSHNRHVLAIAAYCGLFNHPLNTFCMFIYPGLIYRFTFDFGLTLSAEFGAGYLHSWVGAPSYTLSNSTLVNVPDYGQPSFMPLFALGIGWDFSESCNLPISAFCKLATFGQYPYNTYLLPRFALILGANYYLF